MLCNSLRQAAIGADDNEKAATERFVININFGTNKIDKVIELEPHTTDKEPDLGDERWRVNTPGARR
jgi:hypothetical protein